MEQHRSITRVYSFKFVKNASIFCFSIPTTVTLISPPEQIWISRAAVLQSALLRLPFI